MFFCYYDCRPYVRTTYGTPVVGKNRDAFRRSSLCDVPPLLPSHPKTRRGRIQKSPPCWDRKRLRHSVLCNLIGPTNCHWVSPQISYISLGMVRCILLKKHLGTIPSIFLTLSNTALAWNRPWQGHLRHLTICQMWRPTQPVLAASFGDQRPPLLPPTTNGNRHSQPAPWLTPSGFSEEFLDTLGEDQGGENPAADHSRELHYWVQTRYGDTCIQAYHLMYQNVQGLTGGGNLKKKLSSW